MGQQQLLLLVLGIVIVGLAVVVGINAFGENQKRANADAMVNDALRMASDIQAYALKPEQFGGAGGFGSIESITNSSDFFEQNLGYTLEDGDTEYNNVNGQYVISGGGTDDLVITANNTDQSNSVYVTVCGVTSREILTAIDYAGSDGSITARECSELDA